MKITWELFHQKRKEMDEAIAEYKRSVIAMAPKSIQHPLWAKAAKLISEVDQIIDVLERRNGKH